MYSIWLMEYAHVAQQPLSSVLSGQHNKGTRELAFTYALLVGGGHTVLIDTGTNGEDEHTKELHKRDGVQLWQPPQEVLGKVGVKPEDVDTVLITHAHYDHMDNLRAFPKAQFIVQEKEILGWTWAMSREKRFRAPNMALKPDNIHEALRLVEEGRMKLVDGEVRDILPGIDLYPAYDGHTFASQIVAVRRGDDALAFVGDIVYVRENIGGINGDGVYVPVGLAVGSPYNQMKSFDDIVRIVKGKKENIVIGHETDNWTLYSSRKYDDGLHVAEICLAQGDKTRI
jgi:N-acyl homoserine lactone hydrolase